MFRGGVYVAEHTLRGESVPCPPLANTARGSERNLFVKEVHWDFFDKTQASGVRSSGGSSAGLTCTMQWRMLGKQCSTAW